MMTDVIYVRKSCFRIALKIKFGKACSFFDIVVAKYWSYSILS